jgi:hypothetical protein
MKTRKTVGEPYVRKEYEQVFYTFLSRESVLHNISVYTGKTTDKARYMPTNLTQA